MLAVKVFGKQDMRVVNVPKPTIDKPSDIIVKVKACGICGSDKAIYNGSNPFVELPRVMGHEFVGEIVEIGDEVTEFAVGDHVVIEPISYDGKCYACRQHMPNACVNLKVLGVHQDGGMQEYIKVPALQLHHIDKDIPWTTAVLSEPYTIAGNATTRGEVGLSKTVVIQGAGTIGQLSLRVAKAKGARVMISDVAQDKLDFAKDNGADAVVNVKNEDLVEKVKEWTNGEMANVVIDAVGAPSTFKTCLDIASVAGRIVPMGFSSAPVTITQQPIMQKQLTICGSRHQTFQFEPIIQAIEAGVLKDDGMTNQRFNIKDAQKALDLMNNDPDKARKIVLMFD
ncbi:zinc-binding alcohol dehydrogenase family protein [Lactiplantibacillus pentosus]|uniref:zinc-binding alcohol dehydrogenase family protein n=1 Tax=Lactiplantibacillus pentosus TaxID=1589 RepID=UPI001C1F0E09|nr:zinc-binding alcohol dehydrogenase family protein [Lactiplantibacillus pentosus]MBU7478609.1 zinc-binding alcohol dehydrogenase family protein [Lactiplantibacillus pentosus]MBU7536405.1 zinc-binding alcohol dehydrogenase family protein [Lactiplantibacillus pentosus]MCT3275825.1 zinc-binding alcohol dehydrogenase family protein [Lactiplantibacillus pentosus]MDT7037304.1 zinc-binding alcohol dehydrogenase family protein [Lactiplantibacillus pentosus]